MKLSLLPVEYLSILRENVRSVPYNESDERKIRKNKIQSCLMGLDGRKPVSHRGLPSEF